MGMKHGHISVAINYLENVLREREQDGKPQHLLERDGEPLSYTAAFTRLAELRAEGLEFIAPPECDNVLPNGSCGMHEGPSPKSRPSLRA